MASPYAADHTATVRALQADLARVQAQLNAVLTQLGTHSPGPAWAPAAQPAYTPAAQPAYAPVAQPTYAPVAQPTYAPAAQPTFAPTTAAFSPAAPAAPTPRGRGTFYAINGWFGDLPFIGYGMNRLQNGVTGDSTAYSRHSEGKILREIVEKHRNGTLARPLVLVGHSLGGGAVTRIASELNTHGIAVDYLGVIDAPYPVAITPNVRKVDNFLTTASLIGKRLTRGEEIRLQGVSHIALGDHPVVHQRIREQAGLI